MSEMESSPVQTFSSDASLPWRNAIAASFRMARATTRNHNDLRLCRHKNEERSNLKGDQRYQSVKARLGHYTMARR